MPSDTTPPAIGASANAPKRAWTGEGHVETPEAKSTFTGRPTLADGPRRAERLASIRAAKNPLLEAAHPLLRAMAEMPAHLELDQVAVFHALLEREVMTFQSLCNEARLRHEHVVAASYAVCTAIDEAASSTRWGGGTGGEVGAWASHQLAMRFHGDGKGGDKVFLLVGRLAAAGEENIDLLEVIYFLLSLGFEGRYAQATEGRHQLETIRQRLFALLASAHGEVPKNLAPHWQGVPVGTFKVMRAVPVWLTASVLGLVLLGQFTWYKYQLVQKSAVVEDHIRAIGALRPPPQPAHRTLRLKELLAPEIAGGTLSVEEDDARSAVRFKGDDMFVAGKARLSAKILFVLAKVAHEINKVPGTVHITGHSDNQPVNTREVPNNWVLSEKRAAAVADVLREQGVASERLQVEGKGDTQPVTSPADVATQAGRARNRRVDLVVTYASMP